MLWAICSSKKKQDFSLWLANGRHYLQESWATSSLMGNCYSCRNSWSLRSCLQAANRKQATHRNEFWLGFGGPGRSSSFGRKNCIFTSSKMFQAHDVTTLSTEMSNAWWEELEIYVHLIMNAPYVYNFLEIGGHAMLPASFPLMLHVQNWCLF